MKHLIYILILLVLGLSLKAQTLDDYLAEAIESNPSIQASYLEFEAALTRVSQENALPDPTISIGYFVSPIETRVGSQQAKISLTQVFPWFGSLSAKDDAAAFLAESKFHQFVNTKNEILLQVKESYYPIYEIQEHIKWQLENIQILNSYKDLATTSFSNGKSSMTDVLRVDIMIDDIETEIKLLQDNLVPLHISFNRLLNKPDSSIVIIADNLKIDQSAFTFSKDSIAAHNPLINAVDAKIRSMEANESVAKKNGLPKIGVGIDYVFINERTDIEIPNNGQDAFMPMVSFSIPIFRGKNNAQIEEAQILQSALSHKKVELENSFISNYENYSFELYKAQELDKLYEEQIKKTEQVIKILYTEYGNSGKDFEEILRMQQQLLKYEMAKATITKAFFIAQARLEYITSKTENYETK